MKYILLILGLFLISSTYSYQNLIDKTIDSHKIKIIQVVLDGKHKVVSSLSEKGDRLINLMDKVYGVSAINGAYFCPADYPNCGGKNYTNAPRFYNGENYSRYGNDFGINGVFAFDKNDKPFMVMNYLWGDALENLKKQINSDRIKNIYRGIGNFPVLLLHGNNLVSLYESQLSTKMKLAGPKSFICSTKDGKTIYMGYVSNITIYDIPVFLKNNFGCYNALNLDAGGSLGMIYNGKVIKRHGRNIMDAFVVVDVEKENKVRQILLKNKELLDRIVAKIKKAYGNNIYVIKALISKIEYLKNKYKNNLKIFVLLNELQIRLENLFKN